VSPAALQLALDGSGTPQLLHVEADPSVRIVFTGRRPPPGAGSGNLSLVVGDGDVARARTAALALIGASPASAVFAEQVHGGEVAVVTHADAGRGATAYDDAVPGVDALVTRAEDLALAVLAADCVPVVLVAPGSAVAAVHAGRNGVVAGVVGTAVARLGAAKGMAAVIGPAIGGCCYEVPADLAAAVATTVPAAQATTSWGTPSLDLPAAVEQQLATAGVTDVQRISVCTRCSHEEFFSHRATTAGQAPAGRQAAIVLRAGRRDGGAPAPQAPPRSLESPTSP
jgi:polyphenol oxidase